MIDIPSYVLDVFFEVLRLILVLTALAGHIYAARNFWEARVDWLSLLEEVGNSRAQTINRILTRGVMEDQFRVATAQFMLFVAGVVAIIISSPGSGRGAWVLIPLVPVSIILAYKSYQQHRRRLRLNRLLSYGKQH